MTIIFVNYSPEKFGAPIDFSQFFKSSQIKSGKIDFAIFDESSISPSLSLPFKQAGYEAGISLGKIYINNFSKNRTDSKEVVGGRTIGDKIIQMIASCSNPKGETISVVANPNVLHDVFKYVFNKYKKCLTHTKWDAAKNDVLTSKHQQFVCLDFKVK